MIETTTDDPYDGDLFNQNANRIPAAEQLQFAGMRVAWSRDGKQILASGHDYEELEKALNGKGIDLSKVVLGYIPGDDEDPILL